VTRALLIADAPGHLLERIARSWVRYAGTASHIRRHDRRAEHLLVQSAGVAHPRTSDALQQMSGRVGDEKCAGHSARFENTINSPSLGSSFRVNKRVARE
jgi:hypothetical protein